MSNPCVTLFYLSYMIIIFLCTACARARARCLTRCQGGATDFVTKICEGSAIGGGEPFPPLGVPGVELAQTVPSPVLSH